LVAKQYTSNIVPHSFPMFKMSLEQTQLMRCLAIKMTSKVRVFSSSVLKN